MSSDTHHFLTGLGFATFCGLLACGACSSVRKARQNAQQRAALLERARNKQLVADIQRNARLSEQRRRDQIQEHLHSHAAAHPPRRNPLPKGRRLPL